MIKFEELRPELQEYITSQANGLEISTDKYMENLEDNYVVFPCKSYYPLSWDGNPFHFVVYYTKDKDSLIEDEGLVETDRIIPELEAIEFLNGVEYISDGEKVIWNDPEYPIYDADGLEDMRGRIYTVNIPEFFIYDKMFLCDDNNLVLLSDETGEVEVSPTEITKM